MTSSPHLCKETGSSSSSRAATEAGPLQPGSEPAGPSAPSHLPWRLEVGDHTHRFVHVTNSDDRTIYYKYGSGTAKEADQDEANARLIVALVNGGKPNPDESAA